MSTTRLPIYIARVSVASAAVMGVALVLLHARMVVSPAAQEMREGAAVWITRLLLEGRNPYALDQLPAATNVYGILYHLTVLPLAMLLGNGFVIHRLVSAVSIVAACALMYRLLRREQADRLIAWVGTILFYGSCLYFVGPLARPDGLGVLLSYAPRILSALRFRQSALGVVLHPVGVLLLVAVQWYALVRRVIGRPATWKGRSYQVANPLGRSG